MFLHVAIVFMLGAATPQIAGRHIYSNDMSNEVRTKAFFDAPWVHMPAAVPAPDTPHLPPLNPTNRETVIDANDDSNDEADATQMNSASAAAAAAPISAPPSLIQNVVRKRSDSLELHCEAFGSPPPKITWFKDRFRLTPSDPYEGNFEFTNEIDGATGIAGGGGNGGAAAIAKIQSRLIVHYLLPIHTGLYTCLAESGGSRNATTRYRLEVLAANDGAIDAVPLDIASLQRAHILDKYYAPRMTLWAQTYFGFIGGSVVLPCQARGNPKPSITWLVPPHQRNAPTLGMRQSHERHVIGHHNKGGANGNVVQLYDGSLLITRLSWAQMGTYTCVAQNQNGTDQAETFLYPLKPE